MGITKQILFITTSFEEERPVIDFNLPSNRAIDWLQIGEILRGSRGFGAYSPPHIIVRDPDALKWDFFHSGGAGLDLLSSKAVAVLKPFGFRYFDFVPAFINDNPYFFIRKINSLDCLDREKSVLVFFPSNPRRVMDIKKYVFNKELIKDPLLFTFPEHDTAIFCTQSVHQVILENNLQGFFMQDAEVFGTRF